MKYSNPQIPEGINVSHRHPLKELLILLGGALVLVVFLSWILAEFGGRLARLVPFEQELSMAPDSLLSSDAPPALQRYLDDLAQRLQTQMDLPEGMTIKLHLSGSDPVNAFATLGGNVLLFRGLVEKLPNENALAMLLAHEIAHVQHRDPIAGVGQAAAVQTMLSLLFGNADLSILGSAGLHTQLSFNRDMERAADAAALAAVYRVYGHLAGANDLFATIQAERRRTGDGEAPAFFSSHPLDQERLDAIVATAKANDWSTEGEVTPLPAQFSRWMRAAARSATLDEQAAPIDAQAALRIR